MVLTGDTASAWNGTSMQNGTCSVYRFNEGTGGVGEDEADDPVDGVVMNEKMRPCRFQLS
ncbi:hypothetical protein IMZ48_23700 [Candidatus Bathyarchaeota archaeon]|nr:hypothetical protein [Candidatus Bathyarchaeota archaeon]